MARELPPVRRNLEAQRGDDGSGVVVAHPAARVDREAGASAFDLPTSCLAAQLGPGERGELVARSRLVTPGYIDDSEATAAMREFGWHHTGDIGYLDEDRYVYIVDRKKDMVISGGFNVYPAEVEAAMLALPEVRECAVIGLPHEKWGEAVVAIVVPTDPASADSHAIIDTLRATLGAVKTPKAVVFVDALPQTAVGKVDKRSLRTRNWDVRIV